MIIHFGCGFGREGARSEKGNSQGESVVSSTGDLNQGAIDFYFIFLDSYYTKVIFLKKEQNIRGSDHLPTFSLCPWSGDVS